jgi:hypothetical protein
LVQASDSLKKSTQTPFSVKLHDSISGMTLDAFACLLDGKMNMQSMQQAGLSCFA